MSRAPEHSTCSSEEVRELFLHLLLPLPQITPHLAQLPLGLFPKLFSLRWALGTGTSISPIPPTPIPGASPERGIPSLQDLQHNGNTGKGGGKVGKGKDISMIPGSFSSLRKLCPAWVASLNMSLRQHAKRKIPPHPALALLHHHSLTSA